MDGWMQMQMHAPNCQLWNEGTVCGEARAEAGLLSVPFIMIVRWQFSCRLLNLF
jgi:hypothetical protein